MRLNNIPHGQLNNSRVPRFRIARRRPELKLRTLVLFRNSVACFDLARNIASKLQLEVVQLVMGLGIQASVSPDMFKKPLILSAWRLLLLEHDSSTLGVNGWEYEYLVE